MKLYVIEEGQLNMLRKAAKRLYTENRMDGDAMRDMAQALDAIVRVCEDIPIPEEMTR
jgi:hypothetical protein